MKKVLLGTVAFAALALASAPASAEGLKLGVGGFYRGYAVFSDSDESSTAAANDSLREFDFRRDSEVFFTGETTTDNGLTVGVHAETDLGGAVQTDEVYSYFSGDWGRVNFGSEDGAAYLLQVAAPSADSNVDGLRNTIQALDFGALATGTANGDTAVLDYDNAAFRQEDRLTYLTPKFSGFQGGFSYAPEDNGQNVVGNNVAAMDFDDTVGDFEDLWEVAARWDGEFQGFGLSAGLGYSGASTEADAAAGAAGSDDLNAWDAGLGVTFGAFSVGGAYLHSDNGVSIDGDTTTWTVGAAWDNGPYHVGASWYDTEIEQNQANNLFATAFTNDVDMNRFAVGGGYTFGEGMTFRGAVAFGDMDTNTAAANDGNFSQVTVGTDIQF